MSNASSIPNAAPAGSARGKMPQPEAQPPSVFAADPQLGFAADPRGGLEAAAHTHDHDGAAAGFVRPARPKDAAALGEVHAAVMLASLDAAHRAAHEAPLPPEVAAMISAPLMAAGWEAAISEPPSPEHVVLVATAAEELVGLAALAPTQGRAVVLDDAGRPTDEATDAADEQGAELIALGVAPWAQHAGHGSRLLAAATDMARDSGATTLLIWAVAGDPSLAGLLEGAGLARTGSTRLLPVGAGVTEECWAASLA